ncbi:MAG: hypothetical protein HYW28_02895, partial [Rhodospirillales bacterium]|nr:hypothetical protein [Rhodospirillales bacterium]
MATHVGREQVEAPYGVDKMAEFADSAVGTDGNATAGHHVDATEGGSVSLPDGFSLSNANFEAQGSDLVLTGADGAQVTVGGFFAQANPPELVGSDGAQISGEVATQLAGAPAGGESISAGTDGHNMIAQNPTMITGSDGEPIGNVENLSGTVFAVRTDGTRVELKIGDSVFQGDIIESSGDGAVGVL